jgi:hypothetical protein
MNKNYGGDTSSHEQSLIAFIFFHKIIKIISSKCKLNIVVHQILIFLPRVLFYIVHVCFCFCPHYHIYQFLYSCLALSPSILSHFITHTDTITMVPNIVLYLIIKYILSCVPLIFVNVVFAY